MHCPKCGHMQASEDMRFCSRCGFALSGVIALLASDGLVTAQQNAPASRPRLSRIGAKIVFLSVVLLPVCLALSILADGPEPLLISAFLFLVGASQIAYKRIFSEDLLPEGKKTREIGQAKEEGYFPPESSTFHPSLFGRDTSDLAPPSITEPTTRLLENDLGTHAPKS